VKVNNPISLGIFHFDNKENKKAKSVEEEKGKSTLKESQRKKAKTEAGHLCVYMCVCKRLNQ